MPALPMWHHLNGDWRLDAALGVHVWERIPGVRVYCLGDRMLWAFDDEPAGWGGFQLDGHSRWFPRLEAGLAWLRRAHRPEAVCGRSRGRKRGAR